MRQTILKSAAAGKGQAAGVDSRDFSGLLKLAGVGGFSTVGDFMHGWSADIGANPSVRRSAFDRITSSGLDVKDPASRIPYVVGGGVVGRAAASYLGASPFWKNVATVVGAAYGNKLYNNGKIDPTCAPYAPGVVQRGF